MEKITIVLCILIIILGILFYYGRCLIKLFTIVYELQQRDLDCPYDKDKFTSPFRVGRKQERAVLDATGKEVVVFPQGMEYNAKEYVKFLNKKS